jgi:hypothetical protein
MIENNVSKLPTRTEVSRRPFASEQIKFHQVSEVIETRELPLFQQAAAKTGFAVNVNATEGQKYTKISGLSDREILMGKTYTEILEKGKSQVIISKELSKGEDFGKFWREYEKLKKTKARKKIN